MCSCVMDCGGSIHLSGAAEAHYGRNSGYEFCGSGRTMGLRNLLSNRNLWQEFLRRAKRRHRFRFTGRLLRLRDSNDRALQPKRCRRFALPPQSISPIDYIRDCRSNRMSVNDIELVAHRNRSRHAPNRYRTTVLNFSVRFPVLETLPRERAALLPPGIFRPRQQNRSRSILRQRRMLAFAYPGRRHAFRVDYRRKSDALFHFPASQHTIRRVDQGCRTHWAGSEGPFTYDPFLEISAVGNEQRHVARSHLPRGAVKQIDVIVRRQSL